MFGINQWELLIILVILLVLFGHRLPSMMRSLGRSVTEFKKGVNNEDEADDETAVAERKKSDA